MIKLLEIANSINQQQVDEGFKEKALALAAAAGMAYGGYKKYVPQDIPEKPGIIQTIRDKSRPRIKLDFDSQFVKSANNIIDYIEGAYVNPAALKNKKEKKVFQKSGETMFGIDRRTGGNVNKTKAGKLFWDIIDADKEEHPEKWKRYYNGGELKSRLKTLAFDIMKPEAKRLFKLLSPEAKEIVESDPRLFFHFTYAVWNGSGHFNDFARSINKRVREGNTDVDYLFDKAIEDRINKGGIIKKKASEVRQAAEDLALSSF